MVVDPEVFKRKAGPTLEEDVKASSFFIENAVAVDGKVLLKAMGKKTGDQITNADLVKLIEPLTNS